MGKRVEQLDPCPDDIGDIARYECQAVDLGRRRKQSVNQGQGMGKAQQRPGLRDRLIDRKNTIGKASTHLREPSVERSRLLWITSPLQLDAASDLGKHQHARADFFRMGASNSASDVGVGSVSLADLGNDVRVE